MAVHDIEMDIVGAGGVDSPHRLAERGEVRGENRRRDPDGLLHESLVATA